MCCKRPYSHYEMPYSLLISTYGAEIYFTEIQVQRAENLINENSYLI
jgi:hypothetical protein